MGVRLLERAPKAVSAELLGEAADVTDVVLTPLDLDHAGGLSDFPTARVHVHEAELAAATAPTLREKARYLPVQWAHSPQWVTHTTAGESWMGLSAVSALPGTSGSEGEVLLVPLHGLAGSRRTQGGTRG